MHIKTHRRQQDIQHMSAGNGPAAQWTDRQPTLYYLYLEVCSPAWHKKRPFNDPTGRESARGRQSSALAIIRHEPDISGNNTEPNRRH